MAIGATLPATAYDGTFVRNSCLSDDGEMVAMCVGYTTGITQTLILSNNWMDSDLGHFCNDTLAPEDGTAIILEYLDAYPADADEDASVLMLAALQDRFPC